MGLVIVNYWSVQCDQCGEQSRPAEPGRMEAAATARRCGWQVGHKTKLCPACATSPKNIKGPELPHNREGRLRALEALWIRRLGCSAADAQELARGHRNFERKYQQLIAGDDLPRGPIVLASGVLEYDQATTNLRRDVIRSMSLAATRQRAKVPDGN